MQYPLKVRDGSASFHGLAAVATYVLTSANHQVVESEEGEVTVVVEPGWETFPDTQV